MPPRPVLLPLSADQFCAGAKAARLQILVGDPGRGRIEAVAVSRLDRGMNCSLVSRPAMVVRNT